ncbi:glucohydrolase [Nocardiopsis sp. TSRI0078]|uniref:glycoside hydrolase family 13 protein n=1 Tax=unclassified Nocardiopsis TaxID=2649073 RepID=UPI00093B8BB6|nr:alpha-glucosidase [Nocardiopsis sp. TSRI0078]OKI17974.1 glucohydrolase [Nocardiopsis sp. TSRI0078]
MPLERSADWWKSSVVYQIYPSSFNDSDGDGVGDLPGVIERLDYLELLGVDVVWLSPVYPSPWDDNGYDISDYLDIHPMFGTLADWDRLRDGLHERGMRLVMDLVVNHTSDEHPWFTGSRSSKDSDKRDFYFWRPGRDGGPPNNWGSVFSGPAWTRDEATDEYYLHLFSSRQPDLNWENPKVRAAVHDVARWWLDRGADGFRMDVINFVSKTPEMPDGPLAGDHGVFAEYALNGPRLHEFLRELHREVFEGRDVLTVGEMPGVDVEQALLHTMPERRELSMVFQFEHVDLDHGPGGKFDPRPLDLRRLKRSLNRWQTELGERGWNSLYWNNHDQPRAVSRFGDEAHRVESATALATTLHMMRGTPYVYQGEELGMTNAHLADIADYRDVETLNHHRAVVETGRVDEETAMAAIARMSRDNARTPMQWDASPGAGFTTGTPWIGINPNHTEINAKAAVADQDSVFHYYRRLIALRKEHPVVVHGAFEPLLEEDPAVYAYTRALDDRVLLVVANWSADTVPLELDPSVAGRDPVRLIGNYSDEGAFAPLRPWEARVHLGS